MTTGRKAGPNDHVCLDTMANIHLLDTSFFPWGIDPDGATTINGANANAPMQSLGTGTAKVVLKNANGRIARDNTADGGPRDEETAKEHYLLQHTATTAARRWTTVDWQPPTGQHPYGGHSTPHTLRRDGGPVH